MSDRVVELLGGQQNLVRRGAMKITEGHKAAPTRRGAKAKGYQRALSKEYFHTSAQSRWKTKSIRSLSAHLVVPENEIYELLNLRGRTAQRRAQQGELSIEESDRLYRIARVTQKAELAFGSETKAREWLKRSNTMFGGATPMSLLGTDAGAEAVTDELIRIEFGDLY